MKKFLTQRQTNISSAAIIISLMIAFSSILGLLRNRVLAYFFSAQELSLYFAAFRLPELTFNILIFGTISAAFIPTFTSYFAKEKQEAWHLASTALTLAIIIFIFLSLFIFLCANPLYHLMLTGFDENRIQKTIFLSRILLVAQGFFLLSYFLTGILESLQRFLVPALSPLFYNLSIILGTIIFANKFGLLGPVIGAVFGALFHFFIQLPLALLLGLKPKISFDFSHPGIKEIVRLATPKIAELSVIELRKSVDLFLTSLIAPGAYTWFTFASSLALLPVSLFGTSIAKASLPTFSSHAANNQKEQFKKTFLVSFRQILFFTLPASIFLIVLRIPLVRLIFGAPRFTWQSTVQTGYALSALSLSIFPQAFNLLIARAFYALHQTKTAVKISVASVFFNIILSSFLVIGLHLPLWSLTLSFSFSSIIFSFILFLLLDKEVNGFQKKFFLVPLIKTMFASLNAGLLMFFLLKILDRSVWSKKLSFLGRFGLVLPTSFEHFVLDTRYTTNLIFLTGIVSLIGGFTYLAWLRLLKIGKIR